MSFVITIGRNDSPANMVTKTVTDIASLTGVLKDGTSIIDPTFLVELTNNEPLQTANYLKVPVFGRNYFIKNITSVRMGLFALECHVDVLTSFADQIRANSGIIKRNETESNTLLNDGFFKVKQNPHIVMYEFENGFTTEEFVLAMAGS